ncbi:MAG: hypothetical protein IV094_17720 [Vitreoscilla sp.]|nr:hypothetical protein [Vitreoscilla sp.]
MTAIANLPHLPSLAALLAAAAFCLPAQAGVSWSIGINAPIAPGVQIGTVINGGSRHYLPAPVYAPAPVLYAPAPVYAPPPVYLPPPVVYAPYVPPVVYAPRYAAPRYYPPRHVRPPVHYPPVAIGIHVRPGQPHWRHDRRDGYGPVAQWRGAPAGRDPR